MYHICAFTQHAITHRVRKTLNVREETLYLRVINGPEHTAATFHTHTYTHTHTHTHTHRHTHTHTHTHIHTRIPAHTLPVFVMRQHFTSGKSLSRKAHNKAVKTMWHNDTLLRFSVCVCVCVGGGGGGSNRCTFFSFEVKKLRCDIWKWARCGTGCVTFCCCCCCCFGGLHKTCCSVLASSCSFSSCSFSSSSLFSMCTVYDISLAFEADSRSIFVVRPLAAPQSPS